MRSRDWEFTDVEVHPVLLLWGPGTPEIAPAEIDGVRIFTNRDLPALHSWLAEPRLDPATAAQIATKLTAYIAEQIDSDLAIRS